MTWTTHTVFNQPHPLSNSNLFLSDTPLGEALSREGADGMGNGWRQSAASWAAPSRWNWGGSPTLNRLNCCATMPVACAWMRFAFILPGTC